MFRASSNLHSLTITLLAAAWLTGHSNVDAVDPADAIAKWEPDIRKLVQRDASELLPADPIVFYGSSSIRRWDTIAEDMSPWPVIQRGYGGARYSDGAFYANRVLGPHAKSARAIVLFFANDIKGGDEQDVSPEVVGQRAAELLAAIRERDADVPVLFIETTPTESRWNAWPEIERANAAIGKLTTGDSNTYLLSTAGAYLGSEGTPRGELFVDDRLHLNEDGYGLWASLIKAKLHSIVGPAIPKSTSRWEADIAAFASDDQQVTKDSLLFVGSSSIRLWKTIHDDLAPWRVVQRGYGGAALSDVRHYARRLLAGDRPKAVVFFVGNDVYSLNRDPVTAARDYAHLLATCREMHGDVPVVWISIRPVLKHQDKWAEVQKLNAEVAKHCTADANAHMLTIEREFLTPDGVIDAGLFADDRVHLNSAGYEIWTKAIRSGLAAIVDE